MSDIQAYMCIIYSTCLRDNHFPMATFHSGSGAFDLCLRSTPRPRPGWCINNTNSPVYKQDIVTPEHYCCVRAYSKCCVIEVGENIK